MPQWKNTLGRLHKRIRTRRQTGAVLVEAALVFIPICIILFGIVELGFVFKDSLTLSSAARSGARAASALSETGSTEFFPKVIDVVEREGQAAPFTNEDRVWIYRSDPSGKPIGDAGCGNGNGSSTCVAYGRSGGKWTPISNPNAWQPRGTNTCLGNGDLGIVGVRVTQHHKAITKFIPGIDNLVLKGSSTMVFEPTSSTTSGCS